MSIYRGMAFPFRKGDQSVPAEATDDELVLNSIEQILLTGRGERVMRPDFGANAYSYVFDNNDPILAERIKIDVRSSIARYEPRAIVQDVSVSADDANVIVTVSFIVVATKNSLTAEVQIPKS